MQYGERRAVRPKFISLYTHQTRHDQLRRSIAHQSLGCMGAVTRSKFSEKPVCQASRFDIGRHAPTRTSTAPQYSFAPSFSLAHVGLLPSPFAAALPLSKFSQSRLSPCCPFASVSLLLFSSAKLLPRSPLPPHSSPLALAARPQLISE